jgi:alpha-galactosidase
MQSWFVREEKKASYRLGNGSFSLVVEARDGTMPSVAGLTLASSPGVDMAARGRALAPVVVVNGVTHGPETGTMSFDGFTSRAAEGVGAPELILRFGLPGGLIVAQHIEPSPDKPVWRSRVVLTNTGANTIEGISRFDAVNTAFSAGTRQPGVSYVLGWMEGPRADAPGRPPMPWKYGGWIPKFLYGEGAPIPPAPEGGWTAPVYRLVEERLVRLPLRSGKRSTYIDQPWVMVRNDDSGAGWLLGFEWSGTWAIDVEHVADAGCVAVRAAADGTVHSLEPGASLESPPAFLGLFHGDADNGFNLSRWYVDDEIIPRVAAAWPTSLHVYWFQNDPSKRTEEYMRREIDAAAAAGFETTYVETIWWEEGDEEGVEGRDFSHGLGSFEGSRSRFPFGFRRLSDYVHERGMKFGVWFEIERADIRTANRFRFPWKPEWIVQRDGFAYRSWCPHVYLLCLGVPAAREWALANLLWAVREYAIDYIMFDSNEWAVCNDPSHGHGTKDGEWAQTEGFLWVMRELRRAHPDLMVMNSSGGSQRADFGIARWSTCVHPHDNSNSSAKQRRYQHGTGCMYPNSWQANFLGAYSDVPGPDGYGIPMPAGRALSDERLEWRVLNRLLGYFATGYEVSALPASQQAIFRKANAFYKRIRHLTHADRYVLAGPQPLLEPVYEEADNWEAYQYAARDAGSAALYFYRCLSPRQEFTARLRGLDPAASYRAESYGGRVTGTHRGAALMEQGITVRLDRTRSAEIILFTRE